MEKTIEAIADAVETGNDEQTVALVKDALAGGVSPAEILDHGLIAGVRALGKMFQDGEAFLPEILISTRAMQRGLNEIKPYLAPGATHRKGTVVIGTVEGDLHDIGKSLVGIMLGSNGFEVVDLGVDVTADTFISAAKEHNAQIIAMSGLLTTTITYFPIVVDAIKKAGLGGKVKVMIGGAPVSRSYADQIGAEGFAEDCVSAVDEALRVTGAI